MLFALVAGGFCLAMVVRNEEYPPNAETCVLTSGRISVHFLGICSGTHIFPASGNVVNDCRIAAATFALIPTASIVLERSKVNPCANRGNGSDSKKKDAEDGIDGLHLGLNGRCGCFAGSGLGASEFIDIPQNRCMFVLFQKPRLSSYCRLNIGDSGPKRALCTEAVRL